jgi:choline dehydrogenase-like flavoprotein
MDDDVRYQTLEALLDRMAPPDDDAGALDAGVGTYVGQRLVGDLEGELDRVWAIVEALDAEARVRFARGFVELSPSEQDELLEALDRIETSTGTKDAGLTSGWPEAPARAIAWFAQLAAEGFYTDPRNGGNHRAVSWKMLRYATDEVPRHPLEFQRPPAPVDRDEYDAIIIGAGAAGGIVAGVLAEAGKHVLLLERGHDLEEQDYRRDHLRNHRLPLYGHNTGPDLKGHPRVAVDRDGKSRVVMPTDGSYSNNAMVVGGGTLVFGGMAFRYLENDFRMATRYGTPAGSSLADWPIGYHDLEPYYDRVEWEIGVSGQAGLDPRAGPRRRGYPMPPVDGHEGRAVLDEGARRLGFSTFPLPLFINSVPYNGRPACEHSNACVGFPCPSNAKNGSHNSLLLRGLRTGNLKLVPRAHTTRIDVDARGKVRGVSFIEENGGSPTSKQVRSRVVILSAGAVESARLLLNSAHPLEPKGLGNPHDVVGRSLQGHVYVSAYGLMPGTVENGRGPGPTRATTRYSHDNDGIIGGGILHDEFVIMPFLFWLDALPPDLRRWGLPNKSFMRDCYRRVLQVSGPIQEIPNPEQRVTIDASVRDRWNLPVAKISGCAHPESLRAAEFLRQRAVEWLHASGAERVWSRRNENSFVRTAGQHQAGTCRMGTDPESSVTDAGGRVHGHDNLYVVDASLHVTNGGFNPSLTIMANAFRCAEGIVRRL